MTYLFSLLLVSGLLSLLSDRHFNVLRFGVFPCIGVAALAAIGYGGTALMNGSVEVWQYPLGLPWLHWHFLLDPLSGFFLVLIGLVVLAVSFFAPTYVEEFRKGPYSLSVLSFFTSLFILGMMLVVVANDSFTFMVSWELMSLSSYFLVSFQHEEGENRRSAFLYLLMAHIGALLILLSFGVLATFGGGFAFDAFRQAEVPGIWATIAFILALCGFGMKAGLVPIHAWLPEAHPVAPSHISALMSGVMLKVAVYGFIRFCFDLVGPIHWEWGVILLVVGSLSALFGVLYAILQHDLKRLLAYSSVENIGIVFIALGLSATFYGTGQSSLGSLALVAALFHALNHALFKSLLFLGAGAIMHCGHEKDMERMGGLINRMPVTAFFFLVGCISISALPPSNGFASEWLTLQSALQTHHLESGVLRAMIPISAAMLALTGALAAACFVKVYGVAFLGQARSHHIRHVKEARTGMLVGQGMLALLCAFFGIFPTQTVEAISHIPQHLLGMGLPSATKHGWLWLTPISPETASYSAPLVVMVISFSILCWFLVAVYRRWKEGEHFFMRVAPWDCGFGGLNHRMQYTATSFSMPIQRIFAAVWRIEEEIEGKPRVRYRLRVEDITRQYLYQPVAHWVTNSARLIGKLQTGQTRHYLAYSFFTLILLLWIIS